MWKISLQQLVNSTFVLFLFSLAITQVFAGSNAESDEAVLEKSVLSIKLFVTEYEPCDRFVGSSTGFIINDHYIVTVRHLFDAYVEGLYDNKDEYCVKGIFKDGTSYDLEYINTAPKGTDIILLAFKSKDDKKSLKNYSSLQFSRGQFFYNQDITSGEYKAIVSLPNANKIHIDAFKFQLESSCSGDDTECIFSKGEVLKGYSGAPVLNHNNQVIGMLVERMRGEGGAFFHIGRALGLLYSRMDPNNEEVIIIDSQEELGGFDLRDLEQVINLDLSGKYSSNDINNITHLEEAHNLQRLDLSNTNIEDLLPLQNLWRLKILRVSHTAIDDISPLVYLSNLEELYFNNTPISYKKIDQNRVDPEDYEQTQQAGVDTSANPSADLKLGSEQALDEKNSNELLEKCSPTETPSKEKLLEAFLLCGLSQNELLKVVHLYETPIKNISFLSNNFALEELRLNNSPIKHIGPLKNIDRDTEKSRFTQLKRLYLNHTRIKGIKPLKELNSLQELYLNNTQISNIGALEGLTELELLHLNSNVISNIRPLSRLTKLQELRLDDTLIDSLCCFLWSLTNLRKLHLNDTQINDIGSLSNLTKLRELNISNTNIKDITSLKYLTELNTLYLSNTRIQNICALDGLRLMKLDLSDNDRLHFDFYQSVSKQDKFKCKNSQQKGFLSNSLGDLLELDLSSNRKFEDIEILSGFRKLQKLDLSSTGLKSINIESLGRLTTLLQLDLSNNNIKFKESKSLESKNLEGILDQLWELNLSSNELTNIGFLKRFSKKNLAVLNLSCNAGLKNIDELLRVGALRKLYLSGTGVSKNDVKGFKKDMPNVQVITSSVLCPGPSSKKEDEDGSSSEEGPQIAITGSEPTNPGDFPFMVRITKKGVDKKLTHCGGSLINKNWVLSAAHCFFDNVTNSPEDESDFLVILGDYDTEESKQPIEQDIEIKKVHFKTNESNEILYNNKSHDNDIALLELESPAILTQHVDLITLLLKEEDFPIEGKELTIVGWGSDQTAVVLDTDDKSLPAKSLVTKLMQAEVKLISQPDCIQRNNNDRNGSQVTANMFCASSNVQDACNRDSGGPILLKKDAKWIQVGIISWGGQEFKGECGADVIYGVYTRIYKYKDWIRCLTDPQYWDWLFPVCSF